MSITSHLEGGGDVKYGIEWTPALVLFGMVIILPLAPAFAMIGLLLVALAAFAALVALAAAILMSPYLIVRTVRRHLAERQPRSIAAAKSAVAT
jgi:hypothetical protein